MIEDNIDSAWQMIGGPGKDLLADHMMSLYRSEDYYDLIELPNGHHVPAPIAKRLVGERIIESIPVSRKTRGQRFFYCAPCDRLQTFIIEKGVAYVGTTQNGYSFFRCRTHKPTTQEENQSKEDMLVRLILGGLYKSLRYVEAER